MIKPPREASILLSRKVALPAVTEATTAGTLGQQMEAASLRVEKAGKEYRDAVEAFRLVMEQYKKENYK